ncbi:MAG: hypothetical protein ACOYN8_01710 [Pseudanabaena sp.]
MSQAGFGDSSSQESISQESVESQSLHQTAPEIAPKIALANTTLPNTSAEPTTLFNVLPRQVLEQELQFCNERSQQAQVLLRQAQEQLQLSQLVIQRQETLTQTLQARIDQLERELQDVHSCGEELRDRLKRQQHHTSQLKAALERCLDTSASKEIAPKDLVMSNLESWSSAKLADEKITPVEQINSSPQQSVVKIAPPLQPIEMPYGLGTAQASEVAKSDDQIRQPEPIDTPSSIAPKMQPISPLIVRTHKAASGSPIALSLLNTRPDLPIPNPNQANDEPSASAQLILESIPKSSSNSSGVREFGLQDLQEITSNDDSKTSYRHDSPISSTSATNSSRISAVVAPKFIRALYSYGSAENPDPPEELAMIANSSPSGRQPVKTLAAVQLPQFPPLPRR